MKGYVAANPVEKTEEGEKKAQKEYLPWSKYHVMEMDKGILYVTDVTSHPTYSPSKKEETKTGEVYAYFL